MGRSRWHQGLFTVKNATEEHLRSDRNLYHDLMHAGIEPKYLPMSQQQEEKGTDVAIAVDALQIGLDGKMDVAVLVTGDGDFVPLVRALNKQGIRVLVAFFDFEDSQDKRCFADDKDFKNSFRGLFRKQNDLKS